MFWRRSTRLHWFWHAVAIFGALAVATSVTSSARAAGLFDFLFGGQQEQAAPAPPPESYAEPPPRVAPAALGSESVHQNAGSTGRTVAYCVRLCDGQNFPLGHITNATPVETCRAMCPASKTKVFFGSEIGGAVAKDGGHYADLDTAFIYRKQLVANCTCNGKDAFGLARFDMANDSTLRPGDIVSTKDGMMAYSGKGGAATYTPVDASAVNAELNPSSSPAASRVQLTKRNEPPPPDDDPGTIAPPQNAPSAAKAGDTRGQSTR